MTTSKLDGIKPGDWVRVTFEGEVVAAEDDGVFFCRDNVVSDKIWFGPRACSAPTFQIERIEAPLQIGDRVTWGAGVEVFELVAIRDDHAVLYSDQRSYRAASVVLLSNLRRVAP